MLDDRGTPIRAGEVFVYGDVRREEIGDARKLDSRCWMVSHHEELPTFYTHVPRGKIQPDGSFVIRFVPSGEQVHLLVEAPSAVRDFYAELALTAGEDREVELRVDPASHFFGTVALPENTPILHAFGMANTTVSIGMDGCSHWFPIAEDGTYESCPLPPSETWQVRFVLELPDAEGNPYELRHKDVVSSLEPRERKRLDVDLRDL